MTDDDCHCGGLQKVFEAEEKWLDLETKSFIKLIDLPRLPSP
jgi:hypothetical protein